MSDHDQNARLCGCLERRLTQSERNLRRSMMTSSQDEVATPGKALRLTAARGERGRGGNRHGGQRNGCGFPQLSSLMQQTQASSLSQCSLADGGLGDRFHLAEKTVNLFQIMRGFCLLDDGDDLGKSFARSHNVARNSKMTLDAKTTSGRERHRLVRLNVSNYGYVTCRCPRDRPCLRDLSSALSIAVRVRFTHTEIAQAS